MAIVKIVSPKLNQKVTAFAETVHKKAARKAAEGVMGLPWGRTVEGEDFWSSVHQRLEQIADTGELK